MQRLNIHEARTISLEWEELQKGYKFRLMYGKSFVTPVLMVYVVDWWALSQSYPIVLKSSKGEDWVRLTRDGHWVEIWALRDFQYCITSLNPPVPREFPKVRYEELFILATKERGLRPDVSGNNMVDVSDLM